MKERGYIIPIVMLGVFIGAMCAVAMMTKLSCDAWGDATGNKTYWSLFGGCYVTMRNGQVVPRNVAESALRQQYSVEIKQR